jgi:hypothetical protein
LINQHLKIVGKVIEQKSALNAEDFLDEEEDRELSPAQLEAVKL